MSLVKRSKCQGCKALKLTENGYECALKVAVDFRIKEVGKRRTYFSPVPKDACYKPKSMRDFRIAKDKIAEDEKSERTS